MNNVHLFNKKFIQTLKPFIYKSKQSSRVHVNGFRLVYFPGCLQSFINLLSWEIY